MQRKHWLICTSKCDEKSEFLFIPEVEKQRWHNQFDPSEERPQQTSSLLGHQVHLVGLSPLGFRIAYTTPQKDTPRLTLRDGHPALGGLTVRRAAAQTWTSTLELNWTHQRCVTNNGSPTTTTTDKSGPWKTDVRR